jgi:hypothetical protein
MMRMTKGWTGLRIAVVALGLVAWSAPRAEANATSGGPTSPVTTPDLMQYSVAGAIGTTGITGNNVVSFVPVQMAQIDPSSNIPLGSFQVAPLPAGQSTTYNNTPFTLTYVPTAFNGVSLNEAPITVTGMLNGTLSGPFQSSVHVSFNPLTHNGFELATGSSSTLNLLPNDQKLLVPSSAGGITTLEGQIASTGLPTPAPEPSTIALFLSTVGGLGLRRYVQARRHRSQA